MPFFTKFCPPIDKFWLGEKVIFISMGSSTSGGKEDAFLEDEEETTADENDRESPVFTEAEKVLAYHGPLIYEAKIQKAEFRKKEWKYFVHYLGWSKNWDEWVGTDRLLKYNDDNIEKQKKLFKNQNGDKGFKGRVPQSKPRNAAGFRIEAYASTADAKGEKEDGKNYVVRGKKRKTDSGTEEKDGDESDQLIKIPFPGSLKKQLVDDWEFVTQRGQLLKLPRSPTVDEILKKYLEFQAKKDSMVEDSVVEILNGLRTYFDKALSAMLLYRQERGQYATTVPESSTTPPSTIYGAEHLLRLFVKLPELLVYTNLEEESLSRLQHKLTDFLKFLQKHQSTFFLSSYDGPKAEVHNEVSTKERKA